VYQEDSVLSSYRKVEGEHLNDRYRNALTWSTEVLEREQQQCGVQGFNSTSPYAQPLMMEKMERSLSCLDEVNLSHCDDQRRSQGHAEVRSAALSGQASVICPLGDDSTLAWAAADGPIWVYNWREGQIVSQMRDDQSQGAHTTAVRRLCTIGDDYRHLASGDAHGDIELWDLTRHRSSVLHVRLHEQALTGLQSDGQGKLLSTSADTYIMIYDLIQQQVVESACPASCDCGSGVPNTVLGISQEHPKIMLVGGADGKLRIWSRGDGPMRRLSTLSCLGGQPMHCQIASDGWRAVLGTVPASYNVDIGGVSNGGLVAFDLRCLGGGGDDLKRAMVSSWDAGPGRVDGEQPLVGNRGRSRTSYGVPMPETTGVVDMALVEEGCQSHVMCIVDNVVRSFNLDDSLAISEEFESPAYIGEDSGSHLCALGARDRFVFVATSTPSLGVWRRTKPDEAHGHVDFVRNEPLPPMLLRATCMPMHQMQQSHADLVPGSVLAHVQDALEQDRQRISAKMVDYGSKTSLPESLLVAA